MINHTTSSDSYYSRSQAEILTRSFVEEVNADAVVVMWTDRGRNATRIFRHDYGNKLLCDALIAHAVTQQCSESDEE